MTESQDPPITLDDRKKLCKPLVLIIDDRPEYSRIFELLAERLEITAHLVESCGEAMRALEQFSFDIVLMDWFMPEVDGPMCVVKIRELEKSTGNHIAIIGVSGSIKTDLQKCLAAGMDDFLAVPFTLEALHDILCKWLQKKHENVQEHTGSE